MRRALRDFTLWLLFPLPMALRAIVRQRAANAGTVRVPAPLFCEARRESDGSVCALRRDHTAEPMSLHRTSQGEGFE